jgi:hypothetical protein
MARPSLPLKTYNLKAGNLVIIGGIVVGGYGKDGGLAYEYAADRYQDDNGADGQTTVSVLNDNRVYVTITLMENSPAYKELAAIQRLQEAQAATPLGVLPLPYLHTDMNNGDAIASGYAVFLTKPAPSKSRTVGEIEFKILLPSAAGTLMLATTSL